MQIVSLILDGLILVLLGATVFYAGRLSLALKSFREGKEDFAKLFNELGQATSQAEIAIQKLRKSTDDSGHDLQLKVNQAKSLSEELQLMTEAATNLADRLEHAAVKNREIMNRIERSAGIGGEALELGGSLSSEETDFELKAGHRPERSTGGFSIQDPELSARRRLSYSALDEDFESEDDTQGDDSGEYLSKAERELARALKKTER